MTVEMNASLSVKLADFTKCQNHEWRVSVLLWCLFQYASIAALTMGLHLPIVGPFSPIINSLTPLTSFRESSAGWRDWICFL